MEIKSFPTHLGPLLVADNFVPPQLQQAIADIARQPIWKYGWRSNSRRDRLVRMDRPAAISTSMAAFIGELAAE